MASVKVNTNHTLYNLYSEPSGPWTYGCELELSDWDRRIPLPPGMVIDPQDVSMVNSNGIAVDPTGASYGYGGEICTAPTSTIDGQVNQLTKIIVLHERNVTVNYRSNLHVHVRVPGLRNDLAMLKKVLRFNMEWLPRVLDVIEPIPIPKPSDSNSRAAYDGARRRYRRRVQSHHHKPTMLAHQQLIARTPKAFFLAGVPKRRDGQPMWGAAARDAVDLKQLLQTDTVEFRHFPGTLNQIRLSHCVEWCRDWMLMATGQLERSPIHHLDALYRRDFPTFHEYNHDLEVKYRATVHDGTVPPADIRKYQQQILEGKFKGSPYYA